MSNLLEVKHISKHYGNFTLQDISFVLPAGYIMGYIGQNGAGKTTTLNAITHLIRTEGGTVTIDGADFDTDPVAYRDRIGYIGDSSYFPQDMTAKNIRNILRGFYPSFRPEVFDGYVRKWQLPMTSKIKSFSRGMKVKLMFASVLSRQTRLLVLDEATNGLDPMIRRDILKLLQEYIDDGQRSVLFSTHVLADLEQIADYIFFIDNGRKILCQEKDSLTEKYLLVRGGPGDLTPELSQRLIGVERGEFGFEALYDTDSGALLPPSLVTDYPGIDQIVVHMIKEMR